MKLSFAAFALATSLVAAVGCQALLKLDSRANDPLASDCELPSGAGPQVRLANLVPNNDGPVDVCMRPAGTADWGRPLLRDGGRNADGGPACQPGFGYPAVSVSFSAPAASIDVKLVPYGSPCSAAALTEGDGLTLATNATTTLVRLGGASGAPEQIVALPESTSKSTQDLRQRFVHAEPGVPPLYFGIASANHLPTNLLNPMIPAAVPFGSVAPAGKALLGQVLANGYLEQQQVGNIFGASPASMGKAVFVYSVPPSQGGATYSVYAIGVASDSAHPQRALICNEDPTLPPDGNDPQELDRQKTCTQTALPTLSIDTLNAGLYGANAAYETQRSPLLLGTGGNQSLIGQRQTDVMCVVEVDALADITTLVGNVQGTFPYSYYLGNPPTTFATPYPPNQEGVTPAYTTPPCAGSVPTNLVDDAYNCLINSTCSNSPGNPTGYLNSNGACIASQCTGALIPLITGYPDCFDCIIDNAICQQAINFQTGKTSCTGNPQARYAWNGSNSSVILSRYPLLKSDYLVLPSTNFRRTVLYSQVQLEDQVVDFYCGFLIPTGIATELPYDGAYGQDAGAQDTSDQGAYATEQHYEVQQIIKWVHDKSATSGPDGKPTPAIIAGDWQSALEYDTVADGGIVPGPVDGGTLKLNPLSSVTQTLLSKDFGGPFTPATAPGWSWPCDLCSAPQNPYTGTGQNYWTQQTFLYNWPTDPAKATVDESLTFTDSKVQLNGDAGQGPPVITYGVNVHLLRPE